MDSNSPPPGAGLQGPTGVEDVSTLEAPIVEEEEPTLGGVPSTPGSRLFLIVASTPRADLIGRALELEPGGDWIIGRGPEARLRLDDPGVSRHHARLSYGAGGSFTLADLGSSNGTFVNGTRVVEAELREGDRIQLGCASVLRFSARRSLEEAEHRQRQALAVSGVGTWEWDVSTRGLAFTGLAERRTRLGGDRAWLAVHPDDRQRLRDELQQALAAGATADLECRLSGEGGRFTWMHLRGELLRDEAGAAFRYAGVLIDVSARKQAEQEMRRQALMFECTSDAVFVVDLAGAILDWNPAAARLLGHSRAEVLGRSPEELLEPGEPAPFLATARALIESESRWVGERKLKRKNGAPCEAELEVIPLRDSAGRHLADLVVCRDVGEQRRLQAQLLLTDRLAALGTLAAGVAHEINNPLSYVQGNLECLRTLVSTPEGLADATARREAVAMLADMAEGIERIGLIVRQLKTYSHAGEGKREGVASVGRTVDYALRIVKSQVEPRARVVQELDDVPEVRISEQQLGQVLVNLLINAAQAMKGAGSDNEIRVSSAFEQASGTVVLRVADSGTGIPPHVLPRIFDPFFTTKPIGVGTGLGLFVCRNIIEAARGTLSVESLPGQGTTFTIMLPMVPRPALRSAVGQGQSLPSLAAC